MEECNNFVRTTDHVLFRIQRRRSLQNLKSNREVTFIAARVMIKTWIVQKNKESLHGIKEPSIADSDVEDGASSGVSTLKMVAPKSDPFVDIM